ncbi:MAG: SRPBCC domain-containing protein [Gammaproteobacteria bacterium]|jgi:uncharacterized protein YndB with AHSA1/START domain
MTTTALASLRLEKQIDATPEDVYAAWVEPELLARWFAPGAMRAEVHELDARVGGHFRVTMHESDSDKKHTAFGEFVELDRPNRIAMTWNWETDNGVRDTLLTASFTPANGGTLVELLHEKLPSQDSADSHTKGWTGCLDNLAARIASFKIQ